MDIPSLEGIERDVKEERQKHGFGDIAGVLKCEFTVEGEVPKYRGTEGDGGGNEGDQIHILDDEPNGFSALRNDCLQDREQHDLNYTRARGAKCVLDELHHAFSLFFLGIFLGLFEARFVQNSFLRLGSRIVRIRESSLCRLLFDFVGGDSILFHNNLLIKTVYHNDTKCQEALFFFFSRKARIFVFRSHYKTLCFGNNQFVNVNELQQDLQRTFSFSDDFKCRRLDVGGKRCLFAYIDGNIDKILLEQDVVRPLKNCERLEKPYLQSLQNTVAYADEIEIVDIKDSPQSVASCDVAFFIEGEDNAYIFSLRKPAARAIGEPPTSSVMKGPREGFIEEIKTNMSLVRKRIKSPDLVVKTFEVGRYSSTTVALMYIRGVADEKIVERLSRKIERIDVDGIVDSAYVLSFIQTKKNSFFIQAGTTEKPDVASAKLLEGRIALIVDGSPIAITLPYLVFEDVQDGYDYYSGDWRASMIRMFRMFGALFTVLLPAVYISLQTYHFQLLPIKFLMTLMAATTNIPFPPAIEMLLVLTLFEVLNQASIRMPRYFGISLSVVGAIVLGDTAVKSGLISSPSVLVVALSAIGIFCVPDQVGAMSILRFLYLCISAVLGFVGMIILTIILVAYLSSLENFGTPYLAPYAPRISPDLQDGMLKADSSSMELRPYSIPTQNRRRINKN